MKTKSFLQRLDEHPNKSLKFRMPGGDLVPGDYHITELKAASLTSVDCGGQRDFRQETIGQLLAGKTGQAMPAHRAASIFRKVFSGPAGSAFHQDAELIFEYDGATGGQLARFPFDEVQVSESALEVILGRLSSVCRPAIARGATGGCCS